MKPEDELNKPPDSASVTTFWREAGPKKWFARDDAFDAEFRQRFTALHLAAARRELDGWLAEPDSALALILLLDQFPRNCWRGTGHMFATDPLARTLARKALDHGHDRQVEAPLRPFFYLPFEHSEDPADQALSVQLHAALGAEASKWAIDHRDIIQRFGRFPHRNAALGRTTTPEEEAFLRGGGFSG